ncbi:hypothetical protein V8G54_017047 [Vigna mungo]|uniref:Uncharacterized protein n=1 Tax=Vigna mungo TaxID=3915 RepID=A0AAQ3NPX8_VIGMU
MSNRYTLGDNPTPCVLPFVYHLGTCISLLIVIRQSNRIELPNTIISLQHNTRILPRDRRTRLHLRPRYLRPRPLTHSSLRHEIVNPTFPILIPSVPILHRGVLYLRPLPTVQLHHRRVELVPVIGRRSAPFQILHKAPVVGNDQSPLKLPRFQRVYSEVGGELHRALGVFGNVAERPVAEDGGVQRCVVIVIGGHDPP